MLLCLDYLLTLSHLLLIGFNLFGWVHPHTRVVHRWTVGATILSWVALGWHYGWGYCLLTDWHWQVKRARGETELPASFIKYQADQWTGLDLDAGIMDILTGMTFAILVVLAFLPLILGAVKRRRGH
jgi:hypothetical protein